MKNPTPITGIVNEKGIFTAKNPYTRVKCPSIQDDILNADWHKWNAQHPQLLAYTRSNVLVTDEGHVEVTGPHWLALIYGKLQIASNTDWKSFQQLKDYWGDRAECKEGYLLVETELTDAKPFKAVDEPEAQPLEGVKTAEGILNRVPVYEHHTDLDTFETKYVLKAMQEYAELYHAQFATDAVNQLGQKEFDELDRIDKAIATDVGGVLQAAENSPSMLRPNYYNSGERSAYKAGAEFGANWQANQAPSTHSSSEMVSLQQYIEMKQAAQKLAGILTNIRHETDYMPDSYYEWIDKVFNETDELTSDED